MRPPTAGHSSLLGAQSHPNSALGLPKLRLCVCAEESQVGGDAGHINARNHSQRFETEKNHLDEHKDELARQILPGTAIRVSPKPSKEQPSPGQGHRGPSVAQSRLCVPGESRGGGGFSRDNGKTNRGAVPRLGIRVFKYHTALQECIRRAGSALGFFPSAVSCCLPLAIGDGETALH